MIKIEPNYSTTIDSRALDEQEVREKCCAKCRYFEDRTCFCRYNPPIPVVVYGKNGQSFVTPVYSKINIPNIDWCQKFEKTE